MIVSFHGWPARDKGRSSTRVVWSPKLTSKTVTNKPCQAEKCKIVSISPKHMWATFRLITDDYFRRELQLKWTNCGMHPSWHTEQSGSAQNSGLITLPTARIRKLENLYTHYIQWPTKLGTHSAAFSARYFLFRFGAPLIATKWQFTRFASIGPSASGH